MKRALFLILTLASFTCSAQEIKDPILEELAAQGFKVEYAEPEHNQPDTANIEICEFPDIYPIYKQSRTFEEGGMLLTHDIVNYINSFSEFFDDVEEGEFIYEGGLNNQFSGKYTIILLITREGKPFVKHISARTRFVYERQAMADMKFFIENCTDSLWTPAVKDKLPVNTIIAIPFEVKAR